MSPNINVGGCKCRRCQRLTNFQKSLKCSSILRGPGDRVLLKLEVLMWEALHSGISMEELDMMLTDLAMRSEILLPREKHDSLH